MYPVCMHVYMFVCICVWLVLHGDKWQNIPVRVEVNLGKPKDSLFLSKWSISGGAEYKAGRQILEEKRT